MRSVEEIAADLRQDITDFIVPIQTTKAVDTSKFERLERHASEAARTLKGSEQLPRFLLNELYVSMKVLRAEAPYCRSHQLDLMADRIEMVFGLILRGESPDDRRPGVPRVM